VRNNLFLFLFTSSLVIFISSCELGKKEEAKAEIPDISIGTPPTISTEQESQVNTLPAIKGRGLNGDSLSIQSIKAKYILLEFWASWCPPCRGANPALVSVYDKYNALGFEIFSISLDQELGKWKSAVEKDNLHWKNHICEFKGWESYWAGQYSITEIPNNVLFDDKGNIIARNLHPSDLDAKLKTLFPQQ
jgi:thiol-disulfide isomerase/thioredoxin